MDRGDILDGRYRIEAMIGRGAMSVVWLAYDRRIERDVAIKVPLGEYEDLAEAQRFSRQGLLAGRLRHRGIVEVHDIGWHGKKPYIVMEHLDGVSLKKVIDDAPGGLPTSRVLDLATQLADALAAAHGAGITHCDIKPGNVTVGPGDRLKIRDFGLAKGANDTQSLAGARRGSAAYFSPDHFTAERIDAKSDMYSLGCLLYALLTGFPPFPESLDVLELMRRHRDAVPLPPRGVETIPDRIREPLDVLVGRLLAKRPEDRPTALAVVAELRRISALAGEPPALERDRALAAVLNPAEEAAISQARRDADRLSRMPADRADAVAGELDRMGPAQAALTLDRVPHSVPPAISSALNQLPPATTAAMLRRVDAAWSARLLSSLSSAQAARVVEALPEQAAAARLDRMSSLDAAAAIVRQADPGMAAHLLAAIDYQRALTILDKQPSRPYKVIMQHLSDIPSAARLVSAAEASRHDSENPLLRWTRTMLPQWWPLAACAVVAVIAVIIVISVALA